MTSLSYLPFLQITFSMDTCPFPASKDFPATIISRNVTIVSLSPEAIAAAAAAGAPLETSGAAAASQIAAAAANRPFWINCQHLDGRFQLHAGFSIEFRSLVLVNCRTLSTAGFITKRHGSTLILNNTAENQGSVCLPVQTAQSLTNTLDRKPGLAVPAGYPSNQQYTSLAGPGSWCSSTAAATAKQSLAPQLLPDVLANRTDSITCQQSALLLGNTAWEENPTPINGSLQNTNPKPENFTMLATRSAILCPNPVSTDCLRQNGSGEADMVAVHGFHMTVELAANGLKWAFGHSVCSRGTAWLACPARYRMHSFTARPQSSAAAAACDLLAQVCGSMQ
jgi:hypothetical protein